MVTRQCGGKQCDTAVEQDRHMTEIACGISHDNTFPTKVTAGDPLRPTASRLRSPGVTAGDPLRPTASRLRSPGVTAGDPLRPTASRLRSPGVTAGDPLRPTASRLRSPGD